MVGSFDRHVHPDEPDRPDRRDAGAGQPKAPRETEAQLAERLGLSTLTRRAAYESLYAKAQAQDAPFRERLAREEREKSAGPPGSLTAPADAPAPPKPPVDKPERDGRSHPQLLDRSPPLPRELAAPRGRMAGQVVTWSPTLRAKSVTTMSAQKTCRSGETR